MTANAVTDPTGGGDASQGMAELPAGGVVQIIQANRDRVCFGVALMIGQQGYLQLFNNAAMPCGIPVTNDRTVWIWWGKHGPLVQNSWQVYNPTASTIMVTVFEVIKPESGWAYIP